MECRAKPVSFLEVIPNHSKPIYKCFKPCNRQCTCCCFQTHHSVVDFVAPTHIAREHVNEMQFAFLAGKLLPLLLLLLLQSKQFDTIVSPWIIGISGYEVCFLGLIVECVVDGLFKFHMRFTFFYVCSIIRSFNMFHVCLTHESHSVYWEMSKDWNWVEIVGGICCF